LGPVTLELAGREIKIKSRKSCAVLAYLALGERHQETRERLVGLLWSEFEEEKARASLRQTLRQLRQAFAEAGYDGLRTETLAVEFDKGRIDLDLWAVIREAEAARVHPRLLNAPRLSDSLLEGLEDLDPSFRVWVLAKRQSLHDRLVRALEAGLRNEQLDARRRSLIAEAILNLDPTHEEACRTLIQARAEAGDTAGALRAYKSLWDLLDEDYGMEPSVQTQKLVAAVKTGAFEPAAPALGAASVKAPPLPSPTPLTRLALYFGPVEMRAIDPDKVHLVQGFRQHLIACLVRFREWYVTDVPSPQPANDSSSAGGGRYELQAMAYQSADALHLVFLLKEVEKNVYIWSDGFELKLESWFEEQRRIVGRIAKALNVHVSTERLMRLAGEADVSLSVYDRWLRAQAMILSFSPDCWQRAEQLFNEIIEGAPNFAPAYASLVQMSNAIHIVHPGVMRTHERERRSLELARAAVRLDPVDTRAQLCLGWSHAMAGQYTQSEVHMDLACELNANDPWTLISSALFYAFSGKFDRATRLADQASDMALAPSATHWGYQVSIQFLAGDYAGALQSAEFARDVIKTLPAWRAATLNFLGRNAEAIQEGKRFLSGIRSSWFGTGTATDDAILRWLLHLYPISHREGWERLRDGLKGAELPVDRLAFGGW
jgi:DNA-binding SARP family transcriptional activator